MFYIKFDEFIDDLEFYHEDQTTKSCESLQKLRVRLGFCKTTLKPPVDRSKATLLWWFLLCYVCGLNVCAFSTLRTFSLF